MKYLLFYLALSAAFGLGWGLCGACSQMHIGWQTSAARRRERMARDPYTGLYI